MRVISPDVGGGFGLKLHAVRRGRLVPCCAQRLGRPVKWIEDRVRGARGEPATQGDRSASSSWRRRPTARSSRCRAATSATPAPTRPTPGRALVDPLCAAALLPGLYDVEAVRYEVDAAVHEQVPDRPPTAASAGRRGQTAREALIDDAARELGHRPARAAAAEHDPGRRAVRARRPAATYDGGSYRRVACAGARS